MVAPQGVRDHEPQLFLDQSFQVQVGEHSPVPDKHDAAKGEPFFKVLDYIRHGRLVRGVAGTDVMPQRNPLGRYRHFDDHLPFVEPLVPAVAVPPEVVFLQRPVSFEVGRGDVVEDQVQWQISGKESLRDQRLRLLLAVDQVVHRPEHSVVRRLRPTSVMDRIEPIQKRQIAPRFAAPVDDQHPDQIGRGEGSFPVDARDNERLGQTQAIPNGSTAWTWPKSLTVPRVGATAGAETSSPFARRRPRINCSILPSPNPSTVPRFARMRTHEAFPLAGSRNDSTI